MQINRASPVMMNLLPMISPLLTHRSRLLAVVCSLVMLASGCHMNTYVPTAENLRNPRNPSSAFIHKESQLRGIYGNMDVDAAIYTYQTASESAAEFWTAIDKAATKDNWTVIEDTGLPDDRRRFLRITPKTGQQVFHSVEEARVSFNSESQSAVVAWVQSDQRQRPTSFPTDGPEGNFAETAVWPRFGSETDSPNDR